MKQSHQPSSFLLPFAAVLLILVSGAGEAVAAASAARLDSHLFPYNHRPAAYVTPGAQPETGLELVADDTGSRVRVIAQSTVQSGRARGFSFAAPEGKRIVRAEFTVDANFGTDALAAGIDVPGTPLFWTLPSIGMGQNLTVELPGVSSVNFIFRAKSTVTIPFENWFFAVHGLRVYFDSPATDGGIRVSPKMGGSITYLDLNGQNLVDVNDCGRLIQISAGDGSDNVARCGAFDGNPTKWNPTQACDADICGNYSGAELVILHGEDRSATHAGAWEVDGADAVIRSGGMLPWIGGGQISSLRVRQTTLKTAYPGIYWVEYAVTRTGDGDRNVYLSFELPAVYVRSDLGHRYVAYTGNAPWTGGALTAWADGQANPFQLPDGRRVFPTERWMALTDADHRGLVVYYPEQPLSGDLATVGYVLSRHPGGAPNSNYMTLNYVFGQIPVGQTLTFRLYLAVGAIDEIRPLLEDLPAESPPLPKPEATFRAN